jgi:histidine triad (HIT) family protein
MGSADCIFCKMIAGEIPVTKIYENQSVLAFLDIGPLSDGHTLLIPKQHFAKLHECPIDVLAEVAKYLGKVSKAVILAMDNDGYNVLCNNGSAAGQVVSHLHFHIICRKEGDGVFNRWPTYKYPAGMIEKLAAKIKEKL